MPISAAVALGGNLGNVAETFEHVLTAIEAGPGTRVLEMSRHFLTTPIGAHAGEEFRNAVALIDCTLPPLELLGFLQQIERDLGRVRTTHWGPRTIDLDILSYGDQTIRITGSSEEHPDVSLETGRLMIPHPAAWCRRFVLDPWNDVAGSWQHPVLGQTVEELRNRLLQRPLLVGLAEDSASREDSWVPRFAAVFDADTLRIQNIERGCEQFEIGIGRGTAVAVLPVESRRIVPVPDSAGGLNLAVQMIRAALDEPVPLAGSAS